jgi:hypothetical protein
LPAAITAAIAIARNWTVHHPSLDKGRIDLHLAMFEELQRQIAELKRTA